MQVEIIKSTVVNGEQIKLKTDKAGKPIPIKRTVQKDDGRLLIQCGKALPVEAAAPE